MQNTTYVLMAKSEKYLLQILSLYADLILSKMEKDTPAREATLSKFITFLGLLLKRICFRAGNSFFEERTRLQRETIRRLQKMSPFENTAKHIPSVSLHLNQNYESNFDYPSTVGIYT